MILDWLSIAKYGAILAVILGLVGGGFYMKAKIDKVAVLEQQVSNLQEQQQIYQAQVQKWANLDKRISDLETKRSAAYATTDQNVHQVIHTPSLSDTHLTPEQLCYWNDNGDATATSACLSQAASAASTGTHRN